MTNQDCIKLLKNFLDADNKLKQWPTKRKMQIVGLCYCANFFSEGIKYTEKETNAILNEIATFGDHCMLRRDLVDHKFLGRTDDNRTYWKEPTPDLTKWEL